MPTGFMMYNISTYITPAEGTDVTILLQGLFRKGNVLMEMGRQTEALVQFHHCLKLQTDFAPAKGQIKKVTSSDARMR